MMTIEILSYKTSFFNPLLKCIVIILFVLATWYFYQGRQLYGGKLRQIATLLCIGGLFGILASAFRLAGDLNTGFKWGESVFLLVLAVITIMVTYLVRVHFQEVKVLFGVGEGKEGP